MAVSHSAGSPRTSTDYICCPVLTPSRTFEVKQLIGLIHARRSSPNAPKTPSQPSLSTLSTQLGLSRTATDLQFIKQGHDGWTYGGLEAEALDTQLLHARPLVQNRGERIQRHCSLRVHTYLCPLMIQFL